MALIAVGEFPGYFIKYIGQSGVVRERLLTVISFY